MGWGYTYGEQVIYNTLKKGRFNSGKTPLLENPPQSPLLIGAGL